MAPVTVRKRHTLRKSEIGRIYSLLQEEIGESASLFRGERVEVVVTDAPWLLYLVDRRPTLMAYGDRVFPTLRGIMDHPFPERRLVVDMGAVPYMANGADVMRPGIIDISGDIRADRPLQVVDERHSKPLAVGIALYDADHIREMVKGKCARNIHHVGDDLWNLEI
ncbi:MAG: RNA-binding protein [Methanoculleaceae archaeon]